MKNFNFGFIAALVFLSLIAFTCEKEESPVEVPTKGSIRGNVIDNSTEITLENAIIYTEPGSFQVSTDEYGDYRMNNVEPSDYKIYCYKAGYDTVFTNIKVVAGVESPANFRLSKKDTANSNSNYGTIQGLVKDYNSDALLEKVTIKTSPATSVTFTSSNGMYTISNVKPGTYTVTATKKDYDSSKVSISVTAGNITEANFNLTMVNDKDTTQLGKIRGKVSDVVTAVPIANSIVYTSPSTESVITDQNGEFLINYVTPGTYKVIAQKNEFENDTTTVVVQKNLSVMANLTLRAVSTTLGNIKGKVTDVFTADAIGNANIFTIPSTSSVSTNNLGEYSINNVSPGTYKVIAAKNEYFNDTTEVVVQSGLDAIANLFLKKSYGSLEGTVIRSTSNTGINAAIIMTIPSTTVKTTDLSGKFLFEKLNPGTYKIITEKTGYISDTTEVVIESGAKTIATIILKDEG